MRPQGQGVECGGLNEKCPPLAQIFEHLFSGWWPCVGRFRRCSLEKARHWGHLRVYSLTPVPVPSLFASSSCHCSLLLLCLPTTMDSYPSGIIAEIISPFYKLFRSWCFYHSSRKVTDTVCNTCTWETEAEKLEVQGHPWIASYTASTRLTWDTRDPAQKKKKKDWQDDSENKAFAAQTWGLSLDP